MTTPQLPAHDVLVDALAALQPCDTIATIREALGDE